MLRISFLFAFLLLSVSLFGQAVETYSIIDLELDKEEDINILLDLGIAADHVHSDHNDHGGTLELFVSQREKNILIKNGFTFNELIADTKLHADKQAKLNRNKSQKSVECDLETFTLGSVGGYHSYGEVIAILNKINEDHPQLTRLSTLGQSYEGRDIIALKISDNVMLDESDHEPAAYYDALTHAREPLSMMSTLYYIHWLLENYNDPNEVAKFYVDNRELYFVLVVNPDGYVYNAEIAPNGGGGWRKNRKPINDSCIGVDLNRNFSSQWEGPGSHSKEPCSLLYRGESPNSEIEIQIIQDYIDQVKPPLGYKGYGSARDLIGYLASGTTLDYLMEQGAIAWTPEIGTRFWEDQEEICGYTQEMLEPMKFISKIAGEAPSYHDHYVQDGDKVVVGNSVELNVDIINKGLVDSDENIIVELIPLSADVVVENSRVEYSSPSNGQKAYIQSEKFRIDLIDLEIGRSLDFELRISRNDVLAEIKEISIFPGDHNVLFEDDFESGIDNWTVFSNKQKWTISDIDSKSGNHSLVDSRFTYNSETVSVIQTADPISLKDRLNPWLFFNIKYGLWPGSASLKVSVSPHASSWRAIKTDGMSLLDKDDSFTGNHYWTQEFVDLSEFASEYDELYVRFELTVERTNNHSDGVYIDDVKVLDFLSTESTTSTSESIDKPDVQVFPNPTSEIIHINLLEATKGKMDIGIYNSLGQRVKKYSDINPSQNFKVDIGNLPTGPYILQLTLGDIVTSKKIIKN